MELLAEAGVLGGLCALSFLVVLFRFAVSRLPQEQGAFLLAVRTGGLVHALERLYIALWTSICTFPANALLFFLLAFMATVQLNGEARTS
ncbi:MAG: hypothetical protein AAB037_00030 [Chloroflexota bacterium]